MSRQNSYTETPLRQENIVNESLIVELVKYERLLQPKLGGRKLRKRLDTKLLYNDIAIGRDRFLHS